MYNTIQSLFEARLHAAKTHDTSCPNAPITDKNLAALRAHIGADLPKGLLEFFKLADGWDDLKMGDVYDITILSSEEIVGGSHDEFIEDIVEEETEAGVYEGFYPLAFIHEEDSVVLLLIREGEAYTAEAHLGGIGEEEPFLDLWSHYLSEE